MGTRTAALVQVCASNIDLDICIYQMLCCKSAKPKYKHSQLRPYKLRPFRLRYIYKTSA